jgi:hypothetical protein
MSQQYRTIFLTLVFVIIVLVGGLVFDQNNRSIAASQPSTDINLGEEKSQEVVVKLYYDNREQLNAVAGELDIWEVHPLPGIGSGAGYALAAVYPAQRDWLEVLGYRVEIDQEHTTMLQSPMAALDPRYYYFDDFVTNPNGLYIVDFLQATSMAYPNLTELIDIGDAWEGTMGGYNRDMWVLRISNEDPDYGPIASKPPFFLFADIHAREVSTPEMAIRYIKYLTEGYLGAGGYGSDADVTWLVNHHVVYVLVMQNPDGRVKNEQDINNYRRKNMDNDDGCSAPSTLGVDLNRNHSFFWGCCGGSSGNPCGETYRGPTPASEPETYYFQDYVLQVLPDSNGPNGDNELPPAAPENTPGIFISLHSYADEILWSYEFDSGTAPNDAELTSIARKLAYETNVMYPSGLLYTVDGSTVDWIYGKLGIPAYTFEIGPDYGVCGGFFPDYECQDGLNGYTRNFWSEMKPAFLYAHKIAAAPYMTSYGPDALNPAVVPGDVPAGMPVDLTATIADQRYGGDPLKPVAAAEYFIDSPGADGTGFIMLPSDGGWGEPSEPAEAVVETAGLSMGLHYILVHGKNDDGEWGPFTAVFLNISEPLAPLANFGSNSPVQLGQPTLFFNQTIGMDPITYEWTFGDGVGTSTEENPSYTYENTGTYTVTLTATNDYDSDVISNPVIVIPPGIDSVSLSQSTSNPVFPMEGVTFGADILPDNAGKPYNYSIDFGDGTFDFGTSSDDPFIFSHIFSQSGKYTVTIQVQNSSMMMPALDSLEVIVSYRVYLPMSAQP